MTLDRDLIIDHFDLWTSSIEKKSASGRRGGARVNLYGVTKLRNLIIELAIRGEITNQSIEDEPASVLMDRVKYEKKTLSENGRINIKQELSPKSIDDTHIDLPNQWILVKLSDLAYPQAGFSFKSKFFNSSGDGLPIIRIRDVGKPFSETYYSGDFREEFVVQSGDYLISMDGEFRIAEWQNGEALLNQRVSRLIFFGEDIQPDFVAMSLQRRLSELQGSRAYTTVDHLSGKQIGKSTIALPPAAEQRRIVAKVDELMGLCDALEQQAGDNLAAHQTLGETLLGTLTNSQSAEELSENWARIAVHFDSLFTTEDSINRLKSVVLNIAMTGRLATQISTDQPVEDFRKEVEKGFANSDVKPKKARRIEPKKNQSQRIPDNWEWWNFEDVTNPNYPISYGVLVPGDDVEGGIPFVRIADLSLSNPPIQPEKSISSTVEGKYRRTRLEGGEILMGVVGSIGKLGIVPDSWRGANIARAICRIAVSSLFSKRYILWLLQSELLQGQFRKQTRVLAQPTLNIKLIRNALTPVPPIEEQERIADDLERIFDLCDRLSSNLKTSRTINSTLTDAVLSGASIE